MKANEISIEQKIKLLSDLELRRIVQTACHTPEFTEGNLYFLLRVVLRAVPANVDEKTGLVVSKGRELVKLFEEKYPTLAGKPRVCDRLPKMLENAQIVLRGLKNASTRRTIALMLASEYINGLDHPDKCGCLEAIDVFEKEFCSRAL